MSDGSSEKTIVGRVAKNSHEVIYVYLDRFKQVDLAHIRIFVPGADNEMQPTSKGVAFKVGKIDALITALQDARAECARRGLLEPGA